MLQVFWCNRNKTNKQWPDQPLLFTCVNIFLAPALSSANGEYRLLTERVCSRRKGLRKYLLIMNRPKLWLFFFSLSLTLLPPLLHPPPISFYPLLPEMIPPNFDPGVWSSFHDLGQSEMAHCIIAPFMKVFISYLKCFHVHSLCFDLQKEKESSFTAGKTATCEN